MDGTTYQEHPQCLQSSGIQQCTTLSKWSTNTEVSWKDKSYWLVADDLAYEVYQSLASQIQQRGRYFYSQVLPVNLDYEHDVSETYLCVDYNLEVKSHETLKLPDNFGFCTAADDFAEIDIITFLPKYYRVNTLLKSKSYHFDLLNVIRHEIEHVFQDGSFKLKSINLKEHDRSENNFLLEPHEIPAYVHGFRIATTSKNQFERVVSRFIDTHGTSLDLSKAELDKTKNIWFEYLKNLKEHGSMEASRSKNGK